MGDKLETIAFSKYRDPLRGTQVNSIPVTRFYGLKARTVEESEQRILAESDPAFVTWTAAHRAFSKNLLAKELLLAHGNNN
jgi:hypothetical protein